MNNGFVLDTSVAIAWAVASQSDAETDRLLENILAGRHLFVPVHWPLEAANALLVLVRRKRIAPEDSVRARHKLDRLAAIVDQEAPGIALTTLSELAAKHGLSVYDAAYLELAIRKWLPLASRDAALNRAARASGVKTLL